MTPHPATTPPPPNNPSVYPLSTLTPSSSPTIPLTVYLHTPRTIAPALVAAFAPAQHPSPTTLHANANANANISTPTPVLGPPACEAHISSSLAPVPSAIAQLQSRSPALFPLPDVYPHCQMTDGAAVLATGSGWNPPRHIHGHVVSCRMYTTTRMTCSSRSISQANRASSRLPDQLDCAPRSLVRSTK